MITDVCLRQLSVGGGGGTSMFWKDIWNFGSLQQLYPHLFSFAKEPNFLVGRFLSLLPDYGKLFQLPLSIVASNQWQNYWIP
jgi:hypothetical protein